MMKKNEMIGMCFIDKKPCRKDCVLFRSGLRYTEDGKNQWTFEECAVNVMADCMENMVARMIGLQQEQNKVAENVRGVGTAFMQAAEIAARSRLVS